MASMSAWEADWIPDTWELISVHRPAASNADLFEIKLVTSVSPRACKAVTGIDKLIASLRVRSPLPIMLDVPLLMVDCRAAPLLSIVEESPVKAVTAPSSAVSPDPTASKTLVIVGTSRSTRMGSAATQSTKVANGRTVVYFISMLHGCWGIGWYGRMN